MNRAALALAVVLPVADLALAVLYSANALGASCERARRILLSSLLVGHTALVAMVWNDGGAFPLAHAAWVLSAVAGALLLLYAITEATTRSAAGGAVVAALLTLLQLVAALLWPLATPAVTRSSSPFFVPHALGLVLGVAALLLAGCYGLLWLLLWRALRRRSFGALYRMVPNLPPLAKLNRRASLLGFLALALGVNSGIWWAHDAGQSFSYVSPRVLPIILLWLLFGVLAFSNRVAFCESHASARRSGGARTRRHSAHAGGTP